MNKLFNSIEDVDIRDDIGQLSELVGEIDITLQDIANETEDLFENLIRFSASNKGVQYEKVIDACTTLRNELHDASLEMNDLQNQIVAYQNKIYRYEDMLERAARPNQYLVTRRQIDTDATHTKFDRSEMMELEAILKNYGECVYHHLVSINEKKESIASVWRDSQYDRFANFIGDITKDVVSGLKIYDEYVVHLEEKIKEFINE